MSKLDELIKELCPDGVECVALENVCMIKKGVQFNKKDMHDEGTYPVINGGINPSGYIEQFNQEEKTITISQGGASAGFVNWLNTKFWAGAHCYVLKPTKRVLNRYLFHFMKSKEYKLQECQYGAGIPALAKSTVISLKIPVPPLEVQREIVRILDSFTLLTAELTAELTARKKQYEFYRNKLLTFDNNVKIVPLADIADIGTGSSNTNEGLEEGKYPFYVRSQEPLRKNEYEYDETAIITAGDGVGVGKIFHYVEGKYALHQRAYRIHINVPDVLPRYYFHYMRSAFLPYIQKTMFQGSVASIRRPMLNQFPVPVPSLDVQQRLVNVLDNFESICTDLNIGLPAEIEARQKQYEYYRDLLLTFAETGSTLMTDRQTDRAERN